MATQTPELSKELDTLEADYETWWRPVLEWTLDTKDWTLDNINADHHPDERVSQEAFEVFANQIVCGERCGLCGRLRTPGRIECCDAAMEA